MNLRTMDVSREDTDRPTLVVRGEIDLAGAEELREALARLAADSDGSAVLDLRAVTYCGALGLRLVLRADDDCRASGTGLVVLASPAVRRIADLVRPRGLDLRDD